MHTSREKAENIVKDSKENNTKGIIRYKSLYKDDDKPRF